MGTRGCRVCGGSLSRYNSESVCAGCARQIAMTPPVPAWLWDSLPLRRALAEADLGTALIVMRVAAGLSQLELATVLGWSQSTVARVEAGQRDSLYDLRRLFEVVDALGMPREALMPLLLGSVEGQVEREEEDEMSMNRRRFGGGLASLAVMASLSQMRVPRRVDSAHIRYFHASVEKLYTKDQSVGGGALIHDGLRLYHRARIMLDEADYSEEIGRQLMSTVGELAVCAGWLAYDANDQDLSRELYSEARLLADQSGDHGLAIRAMEKMSLQSVALSQRSGLSGGAREAVRLSMRAAELARHDSSPQLHALLAAREAIAHAAVGDSQGFHGSISRAWREVDRGFTDDAPAWLRFVTSSEITVHEAKGHLYLGDHLSASRLYRTSLDATLGNRNCANYRAQLAAALAASGDVSAAVAEAMIVLPALDTGHIISLRTLAELEPVRRVQHKIQGATSSVLITTRRETFQHE
jgi:transcriptional regulator with XRE-family HTH domain